VSAVSCSQAPPPAVHKTGRLHLLPLNEYEGCKPKWLVKGLMVENQPMVIGGPSKALKTSLALDLAVSIASGKPFLNHPPFRVSKQGRVAIYSGESGIPTLKETALRIARSKGLEAVPEGVFLCPLVPRFGSEDDLAELRQELAETKAVVLIIDPAYQALVGDRPVNTANVVEVGGLLRAVREAADDADSTFAVIHHTTKAASRHKRPLGLEDLTQAGFGEFARQWILVNRRGKYDPAAGLHQLTLNYGGSAGHSGLLTVDIQEGVGGEDFAGRVWRPVVLSPTASSPKGRGPGSAATTTAPGGNQAQGPETPLDRKRQKLRRVVMEDFQPGERLGTKLLRKKAGLSNGDKDFEPLRQELIEQGYLSVIPGKRRNNHLRTEKLG
jgi:hypothetical protein